MASLKSPPLDPEKIGEEAKELKIRLHQKIIGQGDAIEQIVDIYQTHISGFSAPGRPIGSFLFLGPTGSGKTRMVEAFAECLVGDARAVIKIDCAEFRHGHEIAKLIGSPPGYLGHRETHPMLAQDVLNRYHTDKVKISFVLFDEIEKAGDALWNLLLGILDKATLTSGDNSRVDFSKCFIFMTSNLGASGIRSLLMRGMGFAAAEIVKENQTGTVNPTLQEKVKRTALEAARRKFTPEFINRIDKIAVFKPLSKGDMKKILKLELNILRKIIFESNSNIFEFHLTDSANDYVLEKGFSLEYGARFLKRVINSLILSPLTNLVASKQINRGDFIEIDFDPKKEKMIFVKDLGETLHSAVPTPTNDDNGSDKGSDNPQEPGSLSAKRPIPKGAVPPKDLRARSLTKAN